MNKISEYINQYQSIIENIPLNYLKTKQQRREDFLCEYNHTNDAKKAYKILSARF